MNLQGIHAATGITTQRLRYVLDQGLLPGATAPSSSRGRGSPRVFTSFEAFGIACAALLVKAGFRRSVIKSCMAALCDYSGGRRDVGSVPLYQAFQERSVTSLEVGDGELIRLVGAAQVSRPHPLSGWTAIRSRSAAEAYEPLVTIQIDVARLRRLLNK